jgi:hypothetical protein
MQMKWRQRIMEKYKVVIKRKNVNKGFYVSAMMARPFIGHHDTQNNDIQHNDTYHNGFVCDTQHNRHSAWLTHSINGTQHKQHSA